MGANVLELSDEQLAHKVLGAEHDLVAKRFRHSMNQLENTAALRVVRREIARLRTEARRREVDAGLQKDTLILKYVKTFSASTASDEASAESGNLLSGIVDKLGAKE